MKLILKGFRCYPDHVFEFPDGLITLLKGPSGCGKSTLFSAIFWCLYRSLKHVSSHSGQKRCSVTLELYRISLDNHNVWEKIAIYRQKNPHLLQIRCFSSLSNSDPVSIYEDEVAQNLIHQIFGSRDLFLASAYLPQGSRALLITAPNVQKIDLLNQISFNTDEPDEILDKIDTAISSTSSEFNTKQAIFLSQSHRFNQDVSAANLDMSLYCQGEERESLEKNLALLNTEHSTLSSAHLSYQQAIGFYTSLVETSKSLSNQLSSLPPVSPEHLTQLEQKIDQLNQKKMTIPYRLRYQTLQRDLEIVERSLSSLPETSEFSPNEKLVTEQDISQATLLYHQYDEGVKLCQQYKCPYNKEAIQEDIALHQKLLDLQPQLQTYSKIQQLENQLQLLLQEGNLATDEDVTQAQQLYHRLQSSLNILLCPSCSKPVRIINNNLVPGECAPASPEEIQQAKFHLEETLRGRQRAQTIKALSDQLQSLKSLCPHCPNEGRLLSASEQNTFSRRITDLSRVRVLDDVPPHPDILRKKYHYQQQILKNQQTRRDLEKKKHQLLSDLQQLQDELSKQSLSHILTSPEPISQMALDSMISQAKLELAQKHQLIAKRKTLQHQLEETQNKLFQLNLDHSIPKRLEEVQNRLSEISQRLQLCKQIDSFISTQTQLEKDRDELLSLQKELSLLSTLKNLAIEVECSTLSSVVDSINLFLADISSYLFDDPITISLNLFKALKTKSRIKPTVNISIQYKGGEYDNLFQLSGGEADRISLALTLALSRLSNCPFLLLDECLASLDANLKETCLKIIRKYLSPNKTVILVCHDINEGSFDHIIDLSQ